MKMVYTHENRLLVSHAKNLLEDAGFPVLLKNEFSSGAMGEMSPFDIWLEVWVHNDEDYGRAFHLIEQALSSAAADDWRCVVCGENNDASFELCWQCQGERSVNSTLS